MSGPVTRFLGDTPLRVLFRLVVLSFLVGLVLSALNIHPFDIYQWLERAILSVYDMGFEVFISAFGYLVIGALIVVPVFLLLRVLKLGGRRERDAE